MERLGDIVKNEIPPIPFQTREEEKVKKLPKFSKKARRRPTATSARALRSSEML